MKLLGLLLACGALVTLTACGNDVPDDGTAATTLPRQSTLAPATSPVPSSTTSAPSSLAPTPTMTTESTTATPPKTPPPAEPGTETIEVTEKITIVVLDADGNVVAGSGN